MKRRHFLTGSLTAGAGLWAARYLPAAEPPITTKQETPRCRSNNRRCRLR